MDTKKEANKISCGYKGCNKTFFRDMDYNRHRKTHERPFKCSICDKSFGLKTDRDRHRNIHNIDAFKFRCKFPKCDFKGTPRKDYLLKHMRVCHEKSSEPAMKQQLRLYYQQSSNEARESNSDEKMLSFLEAVSEGEESLVKEMIAGKVDLCWSDAKGITAGDIAATKGRQDIMQILIDAGIDVNLNKDRPWLLQALEHGHISTAECLLKAGAILNPETTFTEQRSTMLDDMIIKGDGPATQLLLEHGAVPDPSPRLIDLFRQTIFSYNESLVWRFLYARSKNYIAGQEIRHPDSKLSILATETMQESQIQRALAECGAKHVATWKIGVKALLLAVKIGDLRMTKLLLDCGARFGDVDTCFYPSFQVKIYPINDRNRDMVHLLLQRHFGFLRTDLLTNVEIEHPLIGLEGPETPGGLYALQKEDDGRTRRRRVFLHNAVTKVLVELGAYTGREELELTLAIVETKYPNLLFYYSTESSVVVRR